MERIAFTMKLKPGNQEEYKRRHDNLWPEVAQLLRDSGISDYSIFLDRATDTLFAVQKVAGDKGSQDLGKTEIVRNWWAYMSDIMVTNPDNSPVTTPIEEVFHQD